MPPHSPKPDDLSARRDARSDMRFAMAGKALYAVSRVALPPLTLAHVGLEEYGLWATCFVIVSYLGMTASGFALIYLRRTAQLMTVGDTVGVSRLLSTGILTMGGLALALLGALWLLLPHLLAFFQVDPAQRDLARQLWLGACTIFLADMSLGAFANVLHAIGRVRQEQQVWIASFLFETLCIACLLMAGMGIHGLLLAFGLRYALACGLNVWLVRRAIPGLTIAPRCYDSTLLRQFFGAGAVMQASGLLATALHSADKVIAGAALGPAATAVFDLATKLPGTAASAPSGVSGVAVSAAARADSQGDSAAVRAVFADAARMTVLTLGLMLPFMAAFAGPLTTLWLGRTATQTDVAAVMAVLCVGISWHMMTGPASAISRGLGQLWAEFVYHGLRVTLFGAAVLAWMLAVPERSLLPLAVALAVAQTLSACTYLAWTWRRITGALAGAWTALYQPMLAALALAAALHALWPVSGGAGRLAALLDLAAAGTAWVLLYAAMAWFLFLDNAARRAWRERLARRFRRPEPAPTSMETV